MDFRKNNKTTEDYLEFTGTKQPNKVFTCKNKIDPSTCNMVIVYGGLNACRKCKNFVNIETVRRQNKFSF